MIAPLSTILTSFASPFLSLVWCAFSYLFHKDKVQISVVWMLAFSMPLALIVCSRAIPSFPADDLDEYWEFYIAVQGMPFLELLTFSRFEPVLFVMYKCLGGLELGQRGLLFFHSFICSVSYVYCLQLICKNLNLPPWSLLMSLFFFPYELVSNTPRIIFAVQLFVIFTQLRIGWRWVFLLLGVLTHKFLLFLVMVYGLSSLFSQKKLLCTLAPLLVFVMVSLLPSLFSFPLFNRLRYYFVVPDQSGLGLKYLVFCLPFLVIIWLRNAPFQIKKLSVFFYTLSVFALSLSPYGALGDRVGQIVWMPSLLFLLMLINVKKDELSYILLGVLGVLFVFVRLLVITDFENHDPFSQYFLLTAYPISLIKTYLVY